MPYRPKSGLCPVRQLVRTEEVKKQLVMKPPVPSATPTWHNDTYPSISPSRLAQTVAGKTVVIAGARAPLRCKDSGIGREIASAFSDACASKVVLLGRNEANLSETKSALAPNFASCSIHAVIVTDKKALMNVAAQVRAWDILILSAAFVSSPALIAESPVENWWQSFEVFLPTAIPSHTAILGMTTGTSGLPPAMLPGLLAYICSKLAQVNFLELLATENPNVFVASVHPSMVETSLFRKSGAKAEALPMDKVQLPAQFMVWVNWDVDELKS